MPKKTNLKKQRKTGEYVFKINAYSVGTIPMNRLAEYMHDIATVMGEYKNVHFVRVKAGSVNLAMKVDHEAEPKIRDRIRRSRTDEGPDDARNAVRNINIRLAEDDASGALMDPNENNIIAFPGRDKFSHPLIGPIRQPGTLDGTPIRVGGRTDRVPVHLDRFGHEVYMCVASREIAQRIARYIFDKPIRAEGRGSWVRSPDGVWEMQSFLIQDFEVLEGATLRETIQQLRAIDLALEPGEDLVETMANIRSGS